LGQLIPAVLGGSAAENRGADFVKHRTCKLRLPARHLVLVSTAIAQPILSVAVVFLERAGYSGAPRSAYQRVRADCDSQQVEERYNPFFHLPASLAAQQRPLCVKNKLKPYVNGDFYVSIIIS
jgi:hypothetical protein